MLGISWGVYMHSILVNNRILINDVMNNQNDFVCKNKVNVYYDGGSLKWNFVNDSILDSILRNTIILLNNSILRNTIILLNNSILLNNTFCILVNNSILLNSRQYMLPNSPCGQCILLNNKSYPGE